MGKRTPMTKARIVLTRMVNWITKERLPEVIIFGVVGVVMYFSVVVYFMTYIAAVGAQPSYNFEIAILSATLGGFVLIAGFLDNSISSVKKDLLNSAKGFLTASVFSTIFEFTLPMGAISNPAQGLPYYLLIFADLISMMISVLGFTWGVSVLIPCLWKIGREL